MNKSITYLFISPNFDEIRKFVTEDWQDDYDIADIVYSFKSGVWEQGWYADENVMRRYGDWAIYQLSTTQQLMTRMGTVKDFS